MAKYWIWLSLRALCQHLKEAEPDDEDDEDGSYEELHKRQHQLVEWGAVPMALLALSSKEDNTFRDALKLGIAMLSGGSREVSAQTSIG